MIAISEDTKKKLKDGNTLKEFFVKVYKADKTSVDFTISNANLDYESVNFNEKFCSEKELKFGLCEGIALTFKYFGLPDISNRRIETYYKVNNEIIPMGFYEVSLCVKDSKTGRFKVKALNKLNSDIFDADITEQIQTKISSGATVFDLLYDYLKSHTIERQSYTDFGTVTKSTSYPYFTATKPDGTTTSIRAIETEFTFTYPAFEIDYLRFLIDIKKVKDFVDLSCEQFKTWTVNGLSFDDYRKSVERYNRVRLEYTTQDVGINTVNRNIFESENFDSDWIDNFYVSGGNTTVTLQLVVGYYLEYGSTTDAEKAKVENDFLNSKGFDVRQIELSSVEKVNIDSETEIQKATAREIQSAIYELGCQFGKLDRVSDLFYGAELNNGGLYPTATLYPQSELLPRGADFSSFKSNYKELYTNMQSEDSYRNLILHYKSTDEDGNEIDAVYEEEINADGTIDYIVNDNWLLNNLSWHAIYMETFAENMKNKLQPLKWFPFEMDLVGLPYIETGDLIEIKVGDTVYNSYILERNLKGILNLEDSYSNGNVEIF